MGAPSVQDFEELYRAIHACRKCGPGVKLSSLPRQTDEGAFRSGIALMGQAPSEKGVKESGIHWVGADRCLRKPAGAFLDRYLRQVGYSVDPKATGFKRPYTTNALHCWTCKGRKQGEDREPSVSELENCKPWWRKELELIRPRVIILLGGVAAKFFAYVCGDPLLGTLAAKPFASTWRNRFFFRKLLSNQGDAVKLGDLLIRRYVVPHPANWRYRSREEIYQEVTDLLAEALRHEGIG